MADPFTPKFVDLVRNTTTTTGTGNFVLGPAVNGFTGFAAALQVGDGFYYSAIGIDKPAEREVGRGTLLAGGAISRDPISGIKTNFTSGSKSIALIAAAEWFTGMQAGGGTAGGAAAAGVAASRAELAAMTNRQNPVVLTEAGREGLFAWDGSNLSARVGADAAQSIYVPPTGQNGSTGAWARKFSGPINVKWLGAIGDGVADDHTALQAWLDLGGHLYLPAGEYYSSADLILRKHANIEGSGYGFDVRIYNATGDFADMPGSRIRFAAGKGFRADPQPILTDVDDVNAAGVAAFVQEGAMHSRIRDLALIGANAGAAVAGFYTRTLVHLDNVHSYLFTGAGFDFSASSDVDDGNAQYGNADGSSLARCHARFNGSHGFHLRGRDANVIKLDTCNAQLNGGWGFLNDAIRGSVFTNCHAATNTLGSFKASSAVGDSSYIGCYVEEGTGLNCDIGNLFTGQNVVIGGGLAWAVINDNDATSIPNVISGSEANFSYLSSRGPRDVLTSVADRSVFYHNSNYGTIIQGAPAVGGIFDLALLNKNAGLAAFLPTGTTNFAVSGDLNIGRNDQGTYSDSKFLILKNSSGYGLKAFMDGNTGQLYLDCQTGDDATFGGLHLRGNQIFVTVGGVDRIHATATGVDMVGAVTVTGALSATNLSGTNTGDQTITLTGDVTGSGTGSFAATIAAGAVTLAKLANMATASLFYRKTAGTGAPEVQTLATLKADLGLTGTNSGDQTIILTGDVTGSGTGSFAATIGGNVVTYAKFQQVAASSLVGNPTGSLANAQGITLAGGLAFSGTTLTAAGALTPTSVAATGAMTTSAASGGVGYAAGAGAAVTQTTSKSTAVTLNNPCGKVTMNAAALASAAVVAFSVNNSQVAATDTINLNLQSGNATAGAYRYWVEGVAAGSFKIVVENRSGGSLSEALAFNFAVLKAVSA